MKVLDKKVALITGAGSGIGRAIACLYALEGAKVVVSDIDEKGGNETVQLILKDGGDAFFIRADTSKASDHQKLVEESIQKYGALHIAVNNAGIGGPLAPVGEYPIPGWDQVIAVNLTGVFLGMHVQIPTIIKHGGGNVINISSILGKVATATSPAYTAAKHGVIGLTESAAIAYATQNVRVNSIGPGYILTPLLTKTLDPKTLGAIANLHPVARLGKASEVAELALFLASDKASFITGSYFNVDGGYLAQ
jgi:NAD(P)-dependent dehydrogenase (short-subunit alcohol dehydrogenase family)